MTYPVFASHGAVAQAPAPADLFRAMVFGSSVRSPFSHQCAVFFR